jgi:glycosyltransferase involved in cell wall biosynthesis
VEGTRTDGVTAPLLSVVLSFRNEADVLDELVRRLRDVLGGEVAVGHLHAWELIFVNDASTDGSEAILLKAAVGHDDIRMLTMTRPFGVSPCVMAGFEHARGDVVVYMDADLQDPPEVIPAMLEAWRTRPEIDVVHTVRIARDGETRVKLWITKLGYRILRTVSTIDLLIEAGDFKLLSRRAVSHLVALREKKPFLRGLVAWIGFAYAVVPYRRAARYAGQTKFRVLGLGVIRNFLESALISFSDVPLQLVSALGILVSFGAFAFAGYLGVATLRGYAAPPWWWAIAFSLFVGGLQLLAVGILGLYLNAVFLESKRRPPYIVSRTFGFPDAAGSTTIQSDHRAAPHAENM